MNFLCPDCGYQHGPGRHEAGTIAMPECQYPISERCVTCGDALKHGPHWRGVECEALYHQPPVSEQRGRCSRCGAHPFQPEVCGQAPGAAVHEEPPVGEIDGSQHVYAAETE